jgi:hypothetical protein
MPRRFSLAELAATPAAELSAAFRARLAHQHGALARHRSHLPAHLSGAAGRLLKGLSAAEAASSDAISLSELESGAAAAVDDLRGHATHASTQQFLASSFSSLIGQRALVQAAARSSSPGPEDHHAAPEPLLLPKSELHTVLCDAVEDARAFCREKYGDSPETRVLRVREAGTVAKGGRETGDGAQQQEQEEEEEEELVFFAPLVIFPVHELLKNAYGSHCRLVGADRLDRCPPVELRHGTRDGIAFISVSDWGGGLGQSGDPANIATTSVANEGSPTDFLHTSNPERESPPPRSTPRVLVRALPPSHHC